MRIPMHTVLAKGDHSFQRLQDLNLSFLPFRFIAMVMSMVTGVPQSSAVACPADMLRCQRKFKSVTISHEVDKAIVAVVIITVILFD